MFHFGDDVNQKYFPQQKVVQVLGQQFVYGYTPNTERLNLDGYSYSGVYDLTNAYLHHFNIFM